MDHPPLETKKAPFFRHLHSLISSLPPKYVPVSSLIVMVECPPRTRQELTLCFNQDSTISFSKTILTGMHKKPSSYKRRKIVIVSESVDVHGPASRVLRETGRLIEGARRPPLLNRDWVPRFKRSDKNGALFVASLLAVTECKKFSQDCTLYPSSRPARILAGENSSFSL